jgi:hypothetical protein
LLSVVAKILSGLLNALGTSEITPVIFIGTEGQDSFPLGNKAEIRGDDGERALLGHHGQKAGRDDVDAGESESLRVW